MDMVTKHENSLIYKNKIQEDSYSFEYENVGGGKLYLAIKRLFDIVFSVVLGVLALPLMLIVALRIKLGSPGKVLYVQERVGKNGVEFNMLKFRTMVEDAEQGTPVWADEDDPRCTKLGRMLRKCRIDELPQLWNIFVGDMSVVGPRPERRYFYDKFEKYIPGFSNRLKVKPGMTGLAQVSGGYHLSPEEKIIYDMEYIKNRTFWGDMKIICKTLKVVLTHEGAR